MDFNFVNKCLVVTGYIFRHMLLFSDTQNTVGGRNESNT